MTVHSPVNTARLLDCAAVFAPSTPPRHGRVAFWDPHGRPLPDDLGDPATLRLAWPTASGVTLGDVPVVWLPITDAVPVLVRARRALEAHPTAAFWGAVAVTGLHMLARGHLRPGLSDEDVDVWRPGPWDTEDVQRVAALVDALPAQARAIPTGDNPPLLPDGRPLVRHFLDAVVDTVPRSPAAPVLTGSELFASPLATPAPGLRDWAHTVEPESQVRLSVRLEIPGGVQRWADDPDTPWRAVAQVRSTTDPTLLDDAARLWDGGDSPWTAQDRVQTLRAIQRAAGVWEPLGRALRAASPDAVTLEPDEVEDLFSTTADRLAAAGVDVHWPRELTTSLTARVSIGDDTPSDVGGAFRADATVPAEWHIQLADHELTAGELDRLAQTHRRVVRLRDQWVLVDPDIARKARDRVLPPLSAMQAVAAALTPTVPIAGHDTEVTPSRWREALRARLTGPVDDELAEQPAGLTATLRDYQLHGVRWLARMTGLGLGCCLADDMGLGKTITVIALHLHRTPTGTAPMLVVCPASLLGNWEREIQRFAPGIPVHRFHGPSRSLPDAHGGVVLTTYGTMRLDAERLAAVPWDVVVADEAQHVKNPAAATARALRRIPSAARVALTGTPVENNLSELWALLDWASPGLLGTLAEFRARFAESVESDRDPHATHRLHQLVAPFLLRRRKTDPGIAPELPPKTETDQPVALTGEQIGLYEAVVRETMAQIRGSEGIARHGLVLKLFTALKQICNHPAQYLGDDRPLAGRSGKLDVLDELVDTIVTEDGAVLVFTQYVAMARLLRRHLRARGHQCQLLHGGTPVRQRDAMVRRFQDGQVPVFLLSLKAAGTGLNLTRADHVVHVDRWWNPAVEDQATDRAHRIGQTRPVQVHRLIAEGTVEDRIAAMLRSKRDLADAVLAGGEAALTELSDAELAELVQWKGGR